MISPEAYLYCFEAISNDQSNYLALLSERIHVFIRGLFLDFFDDADHINHLDINPLVLVLPSVVFVLVLRFNGLVLDLMDFILLVLQSYLWPAFGLLA